MLKRVFLLLAAVFAVSFVVGSPTGASARTHYSGCCGGPIAPTYLYKTIRRVSHLTRYHDESRTNYVQRIHRIVHVTQVKPLVYIHMINRIHYHTVGVIHPVYQHMTTYLPVERIYSSSTVVTHDCGCQYGY